MICCFRQHHWLSLDVAKRHQHHQHHLRWLTSERERGGELNGMTWKSIVCTNPPNTPSDSLLLASSSWSNIFFSNHYNMWRDPKSFFPIPFFWDWIRHFLRLNLRLVSRYKTVSMTFYANFFSTPNPIASTKWKSFKTDAHICIEFKLKEAKN